MMGKNNCYLRLLYLESNLSYVRAKQRYKHMNKNYSLPSTLKELKEIF